MAHKFDASTGVLEHGIELAEGSAGFHIPLRTRSKKIRQIPLCRENPPKNITGLTLQHGVLSREGKVVGVGKKNSNFAMIHLVNTSNVSGRIVEKIGDDGDEMLVQIDLGTTLTVQNHSRTFRLVYDRYGQLTAEEAGVVNKS